MGLTITEARRRLSELVTRAAAGEEIMIGRYGRDEVAMISVAEWAELQRQAAELTLDAELMKELGALWERARQALGGERQARSWLCKRNRALGGRTPREVAVAEGPESVLRVLARIEHGLVG